MAKKRIYTIAKENSVENQVVLDAAAKLGLDVKTVSSSVDEGNEKKIVSAIKGGSSAKKPAAKPASKPAEHSAAPKADKGENKGQSGDHKTKIKITAVRRDPNKTNRGHFEHNNNHGHNNNNSHNNQNGNRNHTTNNANSNNNNNRPNNNNRYNNGSSNNRSNNNNQRNNGSNSNNNNRSFQSRDRRNNNNVRREQTAQAPRPRQSAGNKYLEKYKTNIQDASRTTNRPNTNRRNNNNSNNNNRSNNNNNRPNNNRSNNRPNDNNRRFNNNNNNNHNNSTRPVAANANNTAAKAKATATPKVEAPKAEYKKPNATPNRNFGHKTNLANPFGTRKKKKERKRQQRQRNNEPKKVMPQRKERPLPETLVYTVGMNAQDLGKILHREPAEIVKKLFMLGIMINQNQSLDKDTIELLATDYGINAEEKVQEDVADIDKYFEEESKNTENQQPRPPVVTIMGHVDHGKTTLLDHLRHTHVTAGEAGGITQHIGAYQVRLQDRLITFLDTPGHAAFTNMRARGADITDIVVLVVAADDGVMPQTIEAINHAKAANDPIIVAVNKIDKPGANPQHVTEQLMEYDLVPEDYGGDTIFVDISAKLGTNVDQLLEMINLEADVLELKANPDQKAVGTVIEAKLDKGRGPVASLLIQQGTLHVGDPVVVGNTYGRVRTMTNDHGKEVKKALPSQPVEITGLNDVPESADKFVVFDDEKTARAAGEERASRALQKERQNTNPVTLDNLFETMKEGELKTVDVIIKADVQGSAEAIAGSLKKIEVKGVRVNIIHQAVGAITESDVNLASASNAIIIGFNVRPTAQARTQAKEENVDIRLHRVIYQAIDEIEAAMKGMLEPVYEEKVTGNLTVRETYNVSKIGTIAGCIVNNGSITRDSGVRLIRDGVVKYEGKLASLKRFKDDVKEVKSGFECGITIENYNDIKIGDEVEAYVMEQVPVK
ncbi:translation initiation factor IF-2 [Companilactobacillus sp.]|jgi:translation initiation factor IF-2|uniref:translation initiation factor IF-2 n=1 Tax=Companilactobacillus sp. TaxID=2767905 RepID=UPI0025B90D85|nr:translation initiation factor IF-2 [Companilactobacillus sp.]MCH4008088.1 translation initiation factor IF-2 [Companilactobacillus sp.]MCH4051733.1 translation initiation factor IF-2 [Companilactobacillus sp.]MCH4076031.1 translation initiation factor IF-2 [Companilactobacillus sp.]MCH4124606.1 translation initiation factor IF-2 [Companilactobacillus sp.]MCH4132431.1 translation initiation factor IF-2 [Companilactobacillus sp.]